jgi:FkbM family methyltransferase
MKLINDLIWAFFLKHDYTIQWKLPDELKTIKVLDLLIEKHFPEGTSPFLLQIGANDGITLDPIHHLVTSAWQGVLVEPNPAARLKLTENYRHCPRLRFAPEAIGEKNGRSRFYGGARDIHYSLNRTEVNREEGSFEVDVLDLSSFLRKYDVKHIDILIVDVEGGDYAIMKQLCNLNSLKPKIIQFEHAHMTKEKWTELCLELNGMGYSIHYFSRGIMRDTIACLADK